jgi:uncharacterized protein (DUF4415 family)
VGDAQTDRVQQVLDAQAARKRQRLDAVSKKKALSLRVDEDVIDQFKSQGEDWEARMNIALRKAVGLRVP